MVEWNRLITLLSNIEIKYLLFTPIILLIGLLFSAIRWHHLLSGLSIHQKIKKLYAYYLIGNFYSIFLPGVIGGDVIRIGICANETKSPIGIITTSTLVERTCGVVVLFVIASLFIFTLPSDMLTSLGGTMTKTLLFVTLFALLTLSIVFAFLRMFANKHVGEQEKTGLVNKLLHFLKLIFTLPYAVIFSLMVFSALFQASDILASFVIARAMNIHLPLSFFFVIVPIVYIATILPVSLGGLGVREGVFVYLLGKVGVPSSDAVALGFLIYMNRFPVATVGGILHILKNSKKIIEPHEMNKRL